MGKTFANSAQHGISARNKHFGNICLNQFEIGEESVGFATWASDELCVTYSNAVQIATWLQSNGPHSGPTLPLQSLQEGHSHLVVVWSRNVWWISASVCSYYTCRVQCPPTLPHLWSSSNSLHKTKQGSLVFQACRHVAHIHKYLLAFSDCSFRNGLIFGEWGGFHELPSPSTNFVMSQAMTSSVPSKNCIV